MKLVFVSLELLEKLGWGVLDLLAILGWAARELQHYRRHKRTQEELEEKSHEANTYKAEFESLNTPPPKIIPRRQPGWSPRNRNL